MRLFIYRFIAFIVIPMRVLRRRNKSLLQHSCEMSMCKTLRAMSRQVQFVHKWLMLANHVIKQLLSFVLLRYIHYMALHHSSKWIDLISFTVYRLCKMIIEMQYICKTYSYNETL